MRCLSAGCAPKYRWYCAVPARSGLMMTARMLAAADGKGESAWVGAWAAREN